MVATRVNRSWADTLLDVLNALIGEPIALIISQPHQALISSASVYLVASEAGLLVGPHASWAMAIGAEWAYLKGLSSGQTVATPWAVRLNWSAVLLVVLYGSLWGMRRFGVPLPEEGYAATGATAIAGAVILTAVHILSISAVTLCSAMVHRAHLDAERQAREQLLAHEQERTARLQAEQDALEQRRREQALAFEQQREAQKLALEAERQAIALEAERKAQDLALWEQAQRTKQALKAPPTHAQAKPTAPRPPCPVCGQELSATDYRLMRSMEGRRTPVRFRGCKTCRTNAAEGAD